MAGKATFAMGAMGSYTNVPKLSVFASGSGGSGDFMQFIGEEGDDPASLDSEDLKFDPTDLKHTRTANEIEFWDSLKETISKNVKGDDENSKKMQKMMKNTFISNFLAKRRQTTAEAGNDPKDNSSKPTSSPSSPASNKPSNIHTDTPSTTTSSSSQSPHRASLLLSKLGKKAKIYNALTPTAPSANPPDEYALAAASNANNEKSYFEAKRDTEVANPFLEKVRRKAAEAKRKQQEKHRRVINPYSNWKIAWDFSVGFLIAYSVIVIPWRISFHQDTVPSTFPYMFEVVLDVIFAIDMMFNFVTGIYLPNGRFIADRKVISFGYIKTWFTIDFISTFPFDRVMVALGDESSNKNNLAVRALKLLRASRLVRLLRVAKILRLDHKFAKLSDMHEHISPALVRLVKLLYKILFVAHLLACFWFFTNTCIPVGSADIEEEADDVWTMCGSNNLVSQYIASFYWTIATMMAVGYGDIYSTTNSERAFAIATQVIGAVAFGFIIATVTIIIETLDPEASAKRRKKDELIDYLNERGYSRELQKKARKHFAYYQAKTSAFAEIPIVSELSHTLREVLLFESRNSIIPNIRLFRFGVSDQFITECVLRLKPMLMSYHQIFGNKGDISEEVYFVTKGRVEGLNLVPNNPNKSATPTSDNASKDGDTKDDKPTHKVVIALIVSDGYEIELSNCLNEKPMDLRYRASSVTDLLWLDHGSLMYLKACFFRSVSAMQFRANRYDRMIKIVLSTPIKEFGENVYMHEKVINNSTLVRSKEVSTIVMNSLRSPNINASKRETSNVASKKIKDLQEKSLAAAGHSGRDKNRRISIFGSTSRDSFEVKARASVLGSFGGAVEEETHVDTLLRTWILDPLDNTLVEKEETEEDLRKRYLLNPGSLGKLKWDLFIGIIIITSIIIVPLRLGFDIGLTDGWLVFDWSTDFFFALDIVINFRTCFLDEQQVLHTTPSLIASNYLRGWLFIDVVSTIPFDKIVALFLDADNSDQLRSLRLIRIVRLVRLAKLIKLLRQSATNHESSEVFSVNPTVTKISRLLATLVFIGHIFGCFFSYITLETVEMYGSNLNSTNVDNFAGGYFPHETTFNPEIPWNGVSSWWVKLGHPEEDIWTRYLASLYWAFTTMTTVGYGDVVPTTDKERIYASFIMILGATVFGYIVGSVSGLASNPHGVAARTNEKNLLISNYLEEQNIKPALRRMAKEQCNFNKNFVSVFDEARILSNFPINIRREMILETNAETIAKISIFSDDVSLITNVMHYLRPSFFAAGQYIYRTSDEGVKAIMFLLDGIAEEVPDKDWAKLQRENSGMTTPTIMKLYSTDKMEEETSSADDKKKKGLHRKIIEAGKCFGYQCFVAESESSGKKPPPTAYRAFTACSVMLLTEYAMKSIIERHPVLREKLKEALKQAILRQTASDEVLNAQVEKFKKKNSMFSSLQSAMTGSKNIELLRRTMDANANQSGRRITIHDMKNQGSKETLTEKIEREKQAAALEREKSKEDHLVTTKESNGAGGEHDDDDLEVEHA